MPIPNPNIPKEPLRWTHDGILREFGHEVRTHETLSRKLRTAEQYPAADGTYTTEQVTAAIYGSASFERVRETREKADNWALKNGILRGELLPRAMLTTAMQAIFIIVNQLVTASSMTTPEKRDLLNTIATWPVAVKNVAAKASKQVPVPSTNGDNDKNGEEEEVEYQV
jgi:hypothetical protein